MPHVALTNRLPRPVAARDVIDLADLHRFHVTVFGDRQLGRRELSPPVRRVRLDQDLRALDDQIGFAGVPGGPIGEHQRLRHVGGIAARRAAIGPLRDLNDLFFAQRRIVLVVLNADVLLDVPRRHDAGLVAQRGPRLHRAGPWPGLFVGQQRHRRDLARPMAVLTAALKNRRNIFGKGDFAGLVRRSAWRGGGRLLRAHAHRGHRPGERHAEDRCSSRQSQAEMLTNRHLESP